LLDPDSPDLTDPYFHLVDVFGEQETFKFEENSADENIPIMFGQKRQVKPGKSR
jgi:hypothetical protein